LVVACAAVFLGFLDTTITNLAVPSVASDFDVSAAAVTWLATAYVIPFAALLASAGALADAVGRTRLLLAGVAVFTVCSLLIAVAPTFGVVLAARAVQGMGAALMTPASLALILAEVPAERRREAIGLWAAAGALAAAIGPAVGGVVVEVVDWRALFCLNLPMGLWVLVAARALRRADVASRRWPDLAGGVLLALAIGSVVYGLTEGADEGWDSRLILGAFIVAVLAGACAVWRSTRHARPALRLDLLGYRQFAVSTALSVIYGMNLFATMLLGVMFLVNVWGYTTLEAGLAMTPAALVTAIVGVGVSRLSAAVPPRRMIVTGGSVLATVTGIFAATLSSTPRLWTLWIPIGLGMGVGIGLITVGISVAGTLSAPPQHFAAATGLIMAARQFGGAVGIAVLAAMLTEVVATSPDRPYAAVYWAAAGAAAAVAAGGLLLRVQPPAPAGPVPAAATVGSVR
jgi:EmrB/QacA subfamily drug resistance transporter